MNAAMRFPPLLFAAILLTSCNLPGAPAETLSASPTLPLSTSTPTDDPPPTATITPLPPTPTLTPVPCDPSFADYCVTDGRFIFQRPILPPGNDSIDPTYPYASTQNGKRDPHHGVEFQNAFGTPVHAAGDGEVVFADSDKAVKFSPWTNFYGNLVVIRHAGEMYTLYAHLSSVAVAPGAQVRAGDVIGQVGQTGGATGSHLHFEVRVGSGYMDYFSTENPELWLFPQPETGAISIALKTRRDHNVEYPLVVARYAAGSDDLVFTYYIKSYARGFEHNAEDAVLNNLPAGRYKIAWTDSSGLRERIVIVEAGRLTEVVFEIE